MIKKSAKVWKHQLMIEFFGSKRTIGVLVIIGIYVFSAMAAASECASDLGVSSTPAGFVFLFNDFICQIVLTAGFVFIMSSAPFVGNNYLYIVGRSGPKAWELGNIFYVFTAAFLYVTFIVLVSWLGLVRTIEFSGEWGKLWGTLAQTSYGLSYELQFSVSPFMVGKYTALFAMCSTFMLELLCYSFLGMLIYLLSRCISQSLGLFASGVLVFFDTLIFNSGYTALYRFSPVTLSQLSRFSKGLTYLGINETWPYIYMSSGLFFMAFLCFICPRREIDNV